MTRPPACSRRSWGGEAEDRVTAVRRFMVRQAHHEAVLCGDACPRHLVSPGMFDGGAPRIPREYRLAVAAIAVGLLLICLSVGSALAGETRTLRQGAVER